MQVLRVLCAALTSADPGVRKRGLGQEKKSPHWMQSRLQIADTDVVEGQAIATAVASLLIYA